MRRSTSRKIGERCVCRRALKANLLAELLADSTRSKRSSCRRKRACRLQRFVKVRAASAQSAFAVCRLPPAYTLDIAVSLLRGLKHANIVRLYQIVHQVGRRRSRSRLQQPFLASRPASALRIYGESKCPGCRVM